MTSFLSRMPIGIAGSVSRGEATIEPVLIDSGTPPTAYGQVVKIVAGKLQPIASADAAAVVYGLTVRPFPFSNQSGSAQGLGAGTFPASGICDVLRRGSMTVALARGTAVKGAACYVRITADTGKLVGDIEDTADSAKCVAFGTFQGAADASGNVEISYNI